MNEETMREIVVCSEELLPEHMETLRENGCSDTQIFSILADRAYYKRRSENDNR